MALAKAKRRSEGEVSRSVLAAVAKFKLLKRRSVFKNNRPKQRMNKKAKRFSERTFDYCLSNKAFIFKNTAGTWGTTAAFKLDQNAGDGNFGISVAISSKFAIVGADGTNHKANKAFIFENTDQIVSSFVFYFFDFFYYFIFDIFLFLIILLSLSFFVLSYILCSFMKKKQNT